MVPQGRGEHMVFSEVYLREERPENFALVAFE